MNHKIIEIGNKPLNEMTAEDLLQIVIIEGERLGLLPSEFDVTEWHS